MGVWREEEVPARPTGISCANRESNGQESVVLAPSLEPSEKSSRLEQNREGPAQQTP